MGTNHFESGTIYVYACMSETEAAMSEYAYERSPNNRHLQRENQPPSVSTCTVLEIGSINTNKSAKPGERPGRALQVARYP